MLNSINSDLIRGHIDTIILSVLQEGDRYGYDILGEIEKKSGGQYSLKQPTLYSCLKRLENQGFIYKYWGTETNGGRRTYYSLTEMGKELFRKNKDEWEHSRGIIDMLIAAPDSPVRSYILLPADGENAEADTAEASETPESEAETDGAAEEAAATDAAEGEEVPNNTDADLSSDEPTESKSASDENAAQNEEEVAANGESDETDPAAVIIADESATAEGEQPDEGSDDAAERIYSDILAEEESNRIMYETVTANDAAEGELRSVSYADRLTDGAQPERSHEYVSDDLYEGVYGTSDYFRDYDGEDDDETYEGEEIDIAEQPPENDNAENGAHQVTMSEYFENDILGSDEKTDAADEQTNGQREFRSYDSGSISEEAQREFIVQREYRNVIRELLRGEYYGQADFTEIHDAPAHDADERAAAETEEIYAYRDGSQADFSNLLTAVRNMGDEITIRTHNSNADKEYNSVYQYYSNKLILYKYGILFLLMIAEILIPYFIIKFAAGTPIKYEVLTLVLTVTGAAILPIYAAIANLIDPYKRKRYNFSMKNSLLFRLAVTILLLVLIYAVNVVLFMDIAFDAEYAFSLITPALMSTNVLLSPIIFQALYDTKKFNVKN